ncbi:hypothetical protein LCGC14_2985800, partial [marine sediment metagenome]
MDRIHLPKKYAPGKNPNSLRNLISLDEANKIRREKHVNKTEEERKQTKRDNTVLHNFAALLKKRGPERCVVRLEKIYGALPEKRKGLLWIIQLNLVTDALEGDTFAAIYVDSLIERSATKIRMSRADQKKRIAYNKMFKI